MDKLNFKKKEEIEKTEMPNKYSDPSIITSHGDDFTVITNSDITEIPLKYPYVGIYQIPKSTTKPEPKPKLKPKSKPKSKSKPKPKPEANIRARRQYPRQYTENSVLARLELMRKLKKKIIENQSRKIRSKPQSIEQESQVLNHGAIHPGQSPYFGMDSSKLTPTQFVPPFVPQPRVQTASMSHPDQQQIPGPSYMYPPQFHYNPGSQYETYPRPTPVPISNDTAEYAIQQPNSCYTYHQSIEPRYQQMPYSLEQYFTGYPMRSLWNVPSPYVVPELPVVDQHKSPIQTHLIKPAKEKLVPKHRKFRTEDPGSLGFSKPKRLISGKRKSKCFGTHTSEEINVVD